MAGAENRNSRVTLAVLSTKVDSVLAMLDKIDGQLTSSERRVAELEKADERLDGRIDRLSDRVSTWTGIQAAISLALASVAAYIGARK